MAESFINNMTDDEIREWRNLSKDERIALARELAKEKRDAKKIKEAEDAAYWKNFRKESQVKKGTDKFRLFPELRSDQPVFTEDYSLENSPEGLDAKAKADEDLGLSGKTLSRGPSNMGDYVSDYASNAWDSFDLGKTLGDWGITGDLKKTTAKINRENTPIPEDVILEGRSARKLNERPYDAEEFLEIEEEPISEFDQEIIDNKLKAAEFSGLSRVDDGAINPEEQAADARRFQREYEEAAFPPEPSWTDHLVAGKNGELQNIDKDLGEGPAGIITDPVKLKLAAAAFIESKLSPSFLGKKKRGEIIDSIIPPITKEQADNYNKKNEEGKGLINTSKKEVLEELGGGENKKELEKIIKKEKVIEELSPATEPPKEKTDIGEKTSDPWMQQSDKFKLDYDPTFLAPKILDYQAAKTDTEREEVLKDTAKDERAAIREEADPKCFWVDPFTGFAINNCELDKRIRRKEEIELAKMFPASDRAIYLARKKVITQGDLRAMLDLTELEQLDLNIKKQKLQEGAYTLISAKLKSEENPQRKEWLKMYINAGSNDNYGLQVLLGTKLGFSKDIMDAAQKAHLLSEKAKLDSKTGGKKAFENAFMVPYSTVVANEMKWIDRATAIVQKEGLMSEYQMDGVTIRDRSGRFRSYGLKEQVDMKTKSPKEQETIYKKSPYYKRMIKNKNFLDADGNFDPTRLTKDKDSYERYLLDTLVWMAMEDLYNEKYTDMMKFVDKNSYAYERSKASMEKKLTASK
jgi:hypothetical protein